MGKAFAAAVVLAWITLAPTPPAAADPDLHTQEQLCRNPAYANMHENECVIRGHGPDGPNSGRGGILGVIGRIVGGLL